MLILPILYALISSVRGAVHESILSVPEGWSESGIEARGGELVRLQTSLKHRDLDQLETILRGVSDPSSPQYGQYLSQSEVTELFGPGDVATDAVSSWLQDSGATNMVRRQNDILFSVTVDQANTMFDTKFRLYSRDGVEKLRTTQYSLPDSIQHHIDFISPTVHFGHPTPRNIPRSVTPMKESKRDLDHACQDFVKLPDANGNPVDWPAFGPRCMSEVYNTAGYITNSSSGISIAFSSFAHQSASFSDLKIYEDLLNISGSNFTILASINNGTTGQDPDQVVQSEANLDVQIIAGLIGSLPFGEYTTGGAGPLVPNSVFPNETYNWNEPFLEYFEYLVKQPDSKLPWVISNSYGDYENTVPLKYAQRVCNLIGMLGLRGRTVLFGSGDMGVGELCQSNSPSRKPQFAAQFPATCPYVTAVGGTQSFTPEVGWNESSGGFSFYFAQPWYQKDAINTYLESNIDPDARDYFDSNNFTNFGGRGFPDISAHSMYPWIPTVNDGKMELGGGTSASTPIVASVIALINDARFQIGQPAVGFANPWLYNISTSGLTDIISGQTTGCLGPFFGPYTFENITDAPLIPYATWNATAGWDPVTGLGTPDFMKMKNLTPR